MRIWRSGSARDILGRFISSTACRKISDGLRSGFAVRQGDAALRRCAARSGRNWKRASDERLHGRPSAIRLSLLRTSIQRFSTTGRRCRRNAASHSRASGRIGRSCFRQRRALDPVPRPAGAGPCRVSIRKLPLPGRRRILRRVLLQRIVACRSASRTAELAHAEPTDRDADARTAVRIPRDADHRSCGTRRTRSTIAAAFAACRRVVAGDGVDCCSVCWCPARYGTALRGRCRAVHRQVA
jgi:hypothetical protein